MLSRVKQLLPWEERRLREAWGWPHVFWLNIFGWWGEEAGSPILRQVLPTIRAIVVLHALSMSAAMVVAIFEKFSKGDIMTNMFTVFASGIATTGMFKMIQIVIHRKTLKSAMDSLDELLSEVTCRQTEEIMRKGFRRCWIVFTISLVSGSCITLHWLTRPLLLAAVSGEKSRIVDTWPVLIDTWPEFAASYAFQSPGVSSIGHSFYLFDNLYFCISECILSHFEILNYRLKKLQLDKRPGGSSEIISCVQYHTKLLRTCNKLRDASTSTITFQCINTVVMACSGVFVLTMIKGLNANVLMNLAEILLIITIVLYSYCWYSNEITFQCGELMKGAYMSKWDKTHTKNQKMLHILMTRSVCPVYFGGILRLNLQTFISVLKTIFTYYNFLLAVNGNGTSG